MIQHDYPACATFRGGQCTCDEAPLARIDAELERLQTAAMNYAQSPAGFNSTANERFASMRAHRGRVLDLVRSAIGGVKEDQHG
jgi:hypothetical protein